MPVQTQPGTLNPKFGQRLAQAHEKFKDAPIDSGFQGLPAGIKNGIAKLSVIEHSNEEKDGQVTPKGEMKVRFTGVVVWPIEHTDPATGQTVRIANMQTSQFVSLCDIPKQKNQNGEEWGGSTFEENWDTYQNYFKLLMGNPKFTHTGPPDPAAIMGFYQAAARSMVDPKRPAGPIYFVFSTTQGKVRPPVPGQQPRAPKVYENWHRVATVEEVQRALAGRSSTPGGVNLVTQTNGQPQPCDAPPTMGADGLPLSAPAKTQGGPWPAGPGRDAVRDIAIQAAGGFTQQDIHDMSPDAQQEQAQDLEAEVTQLVSFAMDDPQGKTEDGAEAGRRLTELAEANGWTKQQVDDAHSWDEVGSMALNSPGEEDAPANRAVIVGSRWKFAKRGGKGEKLTNDKGEEFAPLEYEVIAIDEAKQTVHLKDVKTGKVLCPFRSTKPTDVKIEWLE